MSSVLGAEWHISLSGNDFLTENGTISDKQHLYNCALNTDLKEICTPILNNLVNGSMSKIVLQIHKIRNISAPKANEESQAAPRMLKLTLTDGDNYIQALELSTITPINLKNTPPGTKLLIQDAKVVSGFLLLSPQNCKVLGGKVASLIEKWELTRSVQRNYRSSNEDGPPLWVNFGTKIQTGNQSENYKSLLNKNKDGSKENSEFEQQRQDAIAEASSGAVRKVFSGRVKQSVQVQNNTNKKATEKNKEKKELTKGKGKPGKEKGEIDEKPQKPSEKVSLFAFLEDKLPVSTKEDTFYQNQPIKSGFKDPETCSENPNNYDYKKKKTSIPKQFEKPEYSNKKGQNTRKPSNNSYSQSNNFYPELTPQKYSENPANFSYKPKHFNSNQFKDSQVNKTPQENNSFKSISQNNRPNYHYNASPVQNSNYSYEYNHSPMQPLNSNYQYEQKPISNNNSNPPIVHYQRSNINNHNPETIPSFQQESMSTSNNMYRKTHQKQNDINHISQEVQKMSLNSQFASRSLRQHLNLSSSTRKNDELNHKLENSGPTWNVGDEILAKYWEDGKFYNAAIISITDKTFAVRFKGYGNIEEILKTDCLPIMSNNSRSNNNNNQQYDKNRQYPGSMEFRRSSKNYK
ncbi:tudor domain-containing protein 3 isoform X2 [Diorhabda sublineata]|uniref:tudor domain-containing protein 3 isoform X2 n=1 Tax=Diorhabda sublineata TaxID=1163346 RepID=UPI0024E15B8C|nr:tudor domain-containing protein 3 isoform X2 [Diorhabda sublineata]